MAIEKIQIEFKSNLKEIEKQLSDVEAKIKQLEKVNLNRVEQEFKNINKELIALNNQKVKLQLDIENVTKTEAALQRVRTNLSDLGSHIKLSFNVDLAVTANNIQSLGIVDETAVALLRTAESMKMINESIPDNLIQFSNKLAILATAVGGYTYLAKALANLDTGNLNKGLGIINDTASTIVTAAKAMLKVEASIPDTLLNFTGKLVIMAGGIGGYAYLAKALTKLDKQTLDKGLSIIKATSIQIIVAAKAMKQVSDNVPDEIVQFGAKLILMASAIGGFAFLATALEKLPKQASWSGLALIAGVSVSLILAAEAIGDMDKKIPEDMSGFAAKVGNMAIALGSFGVIVTAVGLLVSSGIGAIVAGAGLATIALMALDLMLVADAIKQLDDKVPSQINQVTSKIEAIQEVMSLFNTSNIFKSLKNLVSHAIQAADTAIISMMMNSMVTIAEDLETLSQVEFNKSNVETKVKDIQSVTELLSSNNGILSGIYNLVTNSLDNSSLSKAVGSIKSILQIAKAMETLAAINLKIAEAKEKIYVVMEVTKSLGDSTFKDLLGSIVKAKELKEASKSIESIVAIATSLKALNKVKVDEDKVIDIMASVQRVIETLGDGSLSKYISATIKASELKKVNQSTTALAEIATNIQSLEIQMNLNMIDEVIKNIKDFMKKLEKIEIGKNIGKILNTKDVEVFRDSTAALKEIADNIESLEIRINMDLVNQVLTDINAFMKKLESVSFTDSKGNILNTDDVAAVEQATTAIKGIAANIEALEIRIAMNLVEQVLADIQSFITKLNNTSFRDKEVDIVDEEDVAIVETATTAIKNIANNIESLEIRINMGLVTQVLDDIEEFMGNLAEIEFSNEIVQNFDEDKIKAIEDVTNALKNVAENIKSLQFRINMDLVVDVLDNIKEFMVHVKGIDLAGKLNGLMDHKDADTFSKATTALVKIAGNIQELEQINIDGAKAGEVLDEIHIFVNKIKESEDDKESFAESINEAIGKDDAEAFRAATEALVAIAGHIKQIQEITIDADEAGKVLEQIELFINKIEDLKLDEAIDSVFDNGDVEEFSQATANLFDIAENIQKIAELDVKADKAGEVIKEIEEFLKIILGDDDDVKGGVLTNTSGLITVEGLVDLKKAITEFNGIADAIKELENKNIQMPAVENTINAVKNTMEQIRDIVAVENLDALSAVIEQFVLLVTTVQNLSESFLTIGTDFATNFINGFTEADIVTNISNIVEELASALQEKTNTFSEIGETWGEAVKTEFETAIKEFSAIITTETELMEAMTATFTTLGTAYGNSFRTSFSNAISGLSSTINEVVSGSRGANYYAAGGLAGVFKPRGTDIIPAMLTPGEFVQKKRAVDTFGLDFMHKVNNSDIRGAFQSLVGRFSTKTMMATTASVINNITNTNNAKVTQHINSGNPDYSFRRANRYLRGI